MTTEVFTPSGDVVGLTDHPRLPRLGKIRLGIKATNAGGREYPRAVDHFVVPEVIQSVYGAKPRELDVVFPSDEVGRVAGVAWKMYSAARGKICTGDGERAARIIDLEKLPAAREPHDQSEYDDAIVSKDSTKTLRVAIPCPAKDCAFAVRNLCKPVMNLMVLLPKVPGIGVWQLDTGSINSILDVRGGIELVMDLSGGKLAGIPLKLRIEPMEVISPDDQKKKIVHTLKLISPATLGKVLMAGERNLRELLMADEGPGRSVDLPALTQGKDVPPAHEPEDDLFTEEQRGKVIDVTPSPHHPEAAQPSLAASPLPRVDSSETAHGHGAAAERGSTGSEVAGSSPAPRSESDLEARVEELFAELGVERKDRGIFKGAYKGRVAELVSFLEKQLASKKQPKP